jgi:hypothetical protein
MKNMVYSLDSSDQYSVDIEVIIVLSVSLLSVNAFADRRENQRAHGEGPASAEKNKRSITVQYEETRLNSKASKKT